MEWRSAIFPKSVTTQPTKWLIKSVPHLELIAALFSGFIILVTWLLESHLSSTWFVLFHLLAFSIGGYAKAKEGITETIQNKELNVELLMIFAAIGSAIIGYWTEGAILIFIFALSGALETYTMNKSKEEISALLELQPEEATRITNGQEEIVPIKQLKIGDTIFVRAGERIPADGIIRTGSTSIDESAITGESIPVTRTRKQEVLAGTVSLDGAITISITKSADETMFQKIINLVQSAQEEKSPSQLFIEQFEGTYVKVVLVAFSIMLFLPYLLLNWSLEESVYRAIILLVVASPCALVASIMPAMLSAISASASKGVLFKGGVHLENLSHIKAIAFDKTGTLTKGDLMVTDAYYAQGTDTDAVLAIAGAIESQSTHPLANAITSYSKEQIGQTKTVIDVVDLRNISGKGIEALVEGQLWQIGKPEYVGKELAEALHDGVLNQLASEGKTVVFVKTEDRIIAAFGLKDTIRRDTKMAIQSLQQSGIKTIMLTGDNERTAKAISEEVGMDAYIANCLPEEKVNHVKELQQNYLHVAMVGDGINDAPSLAAANVGIAMGEGTDVALETADVILMKNDLSKIINAITLSKRMNRIIKQNVFFSIGVIVILILSNYFQAIDLPFGVIGHEGSTILVILNGLRLLK
ncbi:cadmium-translocating P-type ATPase [Ornithinibacillus sp. BX22]|uniref:Cadmium-translocating P-type ATPase n=1 Tax=Ornithinibacillus hominis TaxID=2763055 RepID=A0A923RGQ5_9BACI|nr:heavy metal translocating P-type ATPase [Ornithinibacillus hominis]MBC5636155.1 cadmium-translocating P-type ATPase [Ornithinibacillus hominis]